MGGTCLSDVLFRDASLIKKRSAGIERMSHVVSAGRVNAETLGRGCAWCV